MQERQLSRNESTRIRNDNLYDHHGLSGASKTGRYLSFLLPESAASEGLLRSAAVRLSQFDAFRAIYDRGSDVARVISPAECCEWLVAHIHEPPAAANDVALSSALSAALDIYAGPPVRLAIAGNRPALTLDHVCLDYQGLNLLRRAMQSDSNAVLRDGMNAYVREQRSLARHDHGVANDWYAASLGLVDDLGATNKLAQLTTVRQESMSIPATFLDVAAAAQRVPVSVLLLHAAAKALAAFSNVPQVPVLLMVTGRRSAMELKTIGWLSGRVPILLDPQASVRNTAGLVLDASDGATLQECFPPFHEFWSHLTTPAVAVSFFDTRNRESWAWQPLPDAGVHDQSAGYLSAIRGEDHVTLTVHGLLDVALATRLLRVWSMALESRSRND